MLVSVLGDSISTFYGYEQAEYPVFYTQEKCQESGLSNVSDTWWMRLIEAEGWIFFKNSSYSGRKVVESCFGYTLAEQQACLLRTDEADPDIILLYMGINDFACGVPVLRRERRSYQETAFLEAYDEMLCRLRNMYPDTQILCATLMRTTLKNCPD